MVMASTNGLTGLFTKVSGSLMNFTVMVNTLGAMVENTLDNGVII